MSGIVYFKLGQLGFQLPSAGLMFYKWKPGFSSLASFFFIFIFGQILCFAGKKIYGFGCD